MKTFVSWSGGKDCMFALYLYRQSQKDKPCYLLNMCEADSEKSRSHGLNRTMITAQAEAMNFPLIQQPIIDGNYEQSFKEAISKLKAEGVTTGVFGDIYLEGHRVWIERVCREMNIDSVFPLWGMDTAEAIQRFVSEGFKTIVVAVGKEKLSPTFLGRVIDDSFLNDLHATPNIDLCGENGEYHTFVFDGPLFNHPVSFSKIREYENDKSWLLELKSTV
ncbi:MAG: diphthine--ammonia ligase [Bacteroidia bacterium]|nr:diphthine--ammonia ligase [Bacteroidia bacterium]